MPGTFVRWRIGGVFNHLEIVVGVFIELQHTHGNERELGVGPDFGQIERVEIDLFGLCFGHDLNVQLHLG